MEEAKSAPHERRPTLTACGLADKSFANDFGLRQQLQLVLWSTKMLEDVSKWPSHRRKCAAQQQPPTDESRYSAINSK